VRRNNSTILPLDDILIHQTQVKALIKEMKGKVIVNDGKPLAQRLKQDVPAITRIFCQ
jgi:hypothetical protein